MFEKNKELYCRPCSAKNNKDYALIIDYLRDNPGAAIMEIITATGVAIQSINCFIEDGSFSYAHNNTGGQDKIFAKSEDVEFTTGKFHGTMRSRRKKW